MQRVLILCTGNSARSQMAEGLLRHDAGDRFEVESAGTKPSHVRPEAVVAMKELGIDISGHRSKSVNEFADHTFDHVITVCDNAKESCPIYAGHTNRIHHSFEDPAAVQGSGEERLQAFRRIRDQIRSYLREFVFEALLKGGFMQATHVDCYGKLFPTVPVLAPNSDVTGTVFGYRIEHHGVIPQAPQLNVNSEAWDNCTRCSEFEACYRLSVGTLLMALAVRG